MGSYTHQGLSEVAKIYPQSYNPWGGQQQPAIKLLNFKNLPEIRSKKSEKLIDKVQKKTKKDTE